MSGGVARRATTLFEAAVLTGSARTWLFQGKVAKAAAAISRILRRKGLSCIHFMRGVGKGETSINRPLQRSGPEPRTEVPALHC